MQEKNLDSLFAEFVEWGSAHYAARTVDTYRCLLSRFIKFVGEKKVSQIQIQDITRYIIHLKKKGYAESSVAFMIISIRVFFKYLHLRRIIEWDYQLIKIPRYVSKSHPTIELDEARSMIKSVRADDFRGLRDKMILQFLFATGMRVSELAELTLEELDIENRYAIIISKKSRKRRRIFWCENTAGVLDTYLLEREQWAYDDHLIINCSKTHFGKKVTTRTIQRVVKRHRQGSRVVPHSFRHGLAKDLIKKGANMRSVQEILGHKTLQTVETYTRLYDEEVKVDYDKHRGKLDS